MPKHNRAHASPAATMTTTPPTTDLRAAAVQMHVDRRHQFRASRLALIQQIEAARKSRVVSYVTSQRGTAGAQIGQDAIRMFREELGKVGKVENLDLLLITRGGDTMVPFRLMSLLREFAKKVSVIVPYMAHSAGTLIALGADEIVMGTMGELGPVDPSVTNQFNPVMAEEDQAASPPKPRPRIPISVEDVTSYINFAQKHAGLDAAGMAAAYTALTDNVHPLAIGNILRNHNLIRHLARRLLMMHMGDGEKEKVDSIVKALTEELYAHNYVITRSEGPQIGLKIKHPTADVENWMWELFRGYEDSLGIDRPINMMEELGQEKQRHLCYDLAVIETVTSGFVYWVAGMASRKAPAEVQFNVELQGWQPL
jgi:hypothetical protein